MASTDQVARTQTGPARLPLRVASHVIEIEIQGIRKPETYDKEITCDLLDPNAMDARLGRINEDDEYEAWEKDFSNRFADVQRT